MGKCRGKVIDKFIASPLCDDDGPARVNVLSVEQETEAAGPVLVRFTCNTAVYDAIWVGAAIEWSTRRVVEIISSSATQVPKEWNAGHPDVHFVAAKPTSGVVVLEPHV